MPAVAYARLTSSTGHTLARGSRRVYKRGKLLHTRRRRPPAWARKIITVRWHRVCKTSRRMKTLARLALVPLVLLPLAGAPSRTPPAGRRSRQAGGGRAERERAWPVLSCGGKSYKRG